MWSSVWEHRKSTLYLSQVKCPLTRKYPCEPLGWLGAFSIFFLCPVFLQNVLSMLSFLHFDIIFYYPFLGNYSLFIVFLGQSTFQFCALWHFISFPPLPFLFIFWDRIIWFLRMSYFTQAQIYNYFFLWYCQNLTVLTCLYSSWVLFWIVLRSFKPKFFHFFWPLYYYYFKLISLMHKWPVDSWLIRKEVVELYFSFHFV